MFTQIAWEKASAHWLPAAWNWNLWQNLKSESGSEVKRATKTSALRPLTYIPTTSLYRPCVFCLIHSIHSTFLPTRDGKSLGHGILSGAHCPRKTEREKMVDSSNGIVGTPRPTTNPTRRLWWDEDWANQKGKTLVSVFIASFCCPHKLMVSGRLELFGNLHHCIKTYNRLHLSQHDKAKMNVSIPSARVALVSWFSLEISLLQTFSSLCNINSSTYVKICSIFYFVIYTYTDAYEHGRCKLCWCSCLRKAEKPKLPIVCFCFVWLV